MKLTNSSANLGLPDPIGSERAFKIAADRVRGCRRHSISFKTFSKFVYFKSDKDTVFSIKREDIKTNFLSTKLWQSAFLGDFVCERTVEIHLKRIGDSIYFWPGLLSFRVSFDKL